jgi:hypothetical protein
MLKIIPSANCDKYTGENQPMREKESRNRKYDAAFGIIFSTSTVGVIKEASRSRQAIDYLLMESKYRT